MKKIILITISLFFLSFLSLSCRKEITINETGTDNEGITAGTTAAVILKDISLNDGSFDNIIDNANNISIKMPYTVIVNGQTVVISSTDDLQTVEDILDASDVDIDSIQIVFPVTIILPNYTEVVVHNQTELNTYIAQSTDENEADEDIECIDFVYPVNIQVYNTITEQRQDLTIFNDGELQDIINDLDSNIVINFSFPVKLKLHDGSEITVYDLNEMITVINLHKDDCDEDDDNDYNDDDCDSCSTQQLITVLTTCPSWQIDELERHDTDLESQYIDYFLTFLSNGSLTVTNGIQTYTGQWHTNDTGTAITLQIDLTSLPDFSGTWILEEIKQDGQDNKIKLEIDDNNKMKLFSTCP